MNIISEEVRKIKKLRQEWRKWLGQMDQTQNALANEDYSAFCCLGVAEEKLGKPYGIRRSDDFGTYLLPNPDWMYSSDEMWEEEYIEEESNLHEPLRKALGLSREQEGILIALNDDTEAGFAGISKVIDVMNIHCGGKVFDCYGVEVVNPQYGG